MFIGIDIGGTTILSGLIDKEGNVKLKKQLPTNASRGYEAVEKDIIVLVEQLMEEANTLKQSVEAVGIGVPGIADVNSDNVIYCTNLGWSNVPLGKNLKDKFNIPIYIDNDATVAGIAESAQGVTKGVENSIFVTLGTGVGGGIIINNRVYSGSHNKGSEIGHMIVGENFYDCNCGSNGCLETFASATAIIRYTKKLLEETSRPSTIIDRVDGKLDAIDTKLIFDCAKEGDALAEEAVDRFATYLCIGLGNLINLLDPDKIAIGGGVSKAGDYLLNKINERLLNYVIFKEGATTEIALAELGNDAGIIGAGMLALYK